MMFQFIFGFTLVYLASAQFGQPQNQPIPQQGFPQAQPGLAQPGITQQGFPQQQPNFPQSTQNMNGIPQQPGMGQPQQPGINPLAQQPGMTTNTGTNIVRQNAAGGIPNNQQTQQPQNQQETCAAAGRVAVATCFQNNGGFRMDIVIALLSNGTQGQLPANSNQLKENLCRAQPQIIACILNSIRSFNGTQQCNSLPAYIRLQQETTGLLSGVQQICGNSLLPQVTACMRRLNFDMMNCYTEADLNPELYSPSGSRMNGAIIGDNREIAAMYCKKRTNLFACQDRVLAKCPRARDLQALSGNDQSSMQKGIDVLCKDVNVYVSGLVCFQTPSDDVDKCANKLVTDITQLTMKQIQQNLPTDQFFTEYCKIRINNLVCDSDAWASTCEPVAVGLKREFQCNLLPSVCKNDSSIADQYSRACATSTFSRGLRNSQNGKNGGGTVYGSVLSIFTGIVAVILLL